MYGDRPRVNWFHILIHDPVAMAVLFVLSLAPTVLVGWGVAVGRRIESEGVPGVAALTSGGLDGTPGRTHRPSYYVDYRFSPPGGGQYGPYWLHRTLRATVPSKVHDLARRTRKVPIRYVPGQPQWNLPEKCRTTDKLTLLMAFCLCLNGGLLGCVFLAVYLRRARREMLARQAALDG